ncbi:MAG: HEAT repeat domain-containing protein [Akkermansiaceae bacterium]|nr:HEAT repeat domain-containing protein [Akkermansiaceae bacterium]
MMRPLLANLIVGGLLWSGLSFDAAGQNPLSVSPPEKDNSVAAELDSFELAPGYEANLFADESDGIANPVCMSWDAAGRLWVLCTWVYPQAVPIYPPDDKLLILEDTDGDGRADKTTVFARGLNMPTGFAIGDGGAYVGDGNDLLHLADTDGDDEADTRRVLLTGFGTGDTHQNINSFTWSPGGELLFCQGLHAFSRVETPWGISRLDEHGSWRLRPKRLQLHAHRRTSGGGNPWGIVFGHWGEPFIKSNGPGICELLPGMVQTEFINSYWGGGMDIGKTQIKSMIIEFAESPHLPDDIQGDMLIAGYFGHIIDRLGLSVDGSGHRLSNKPPLLKSPHRAFRPVDIRIGPDGAIYIADWMNPIIGHYQASFRHPDRDKTHGRVWRITAKGRPLAKAPDFSNMGTSELCEHLKSDWRYERYQAKRRLADLPEKEVIPVLEAWITKLDPNSPDTEHHLFEALGVFESHEAVNRPLLETLLAAKDYRARAYATRVVGRWSDRLQAPLGFLDRSVRDKNARVRLEAIVACSDIYSAASMVVAAKATDKPMDRFTDYALSQTAHALAPHWLPALTDGKIQFGRPENLTFVLRAYGGKDVVVQVRGLLGSDDLNPVATTSLMTLLVEIGTPADLRWVLDRALDKPSVLDAFVGAKRVRGVGPAGELVQPLEQMLVNENVDVRAHAIRLAGEWGTSGLTDRIGNILSDGEAHAKLRAAAVESLGQLRGKDALEVIAKAVGNPAPEIRQAALRVLCEIDLPKAAQQATGLLRKAVDDGQVRLVVTPFLIQEGGGAALAAALGTAPISPELATRVRAVLGAAGRYDLALDRLLRNVAADGSIGLPKHNEAYVRTLSSEVEESGNSENGAKIYASAGLSCVACHKLGEAGGVLGPELTAVGAGVPIELLIEAVLWPKRQIKEGYASTTLTTKDGKVIGGYVDTENEQRIVIRDAATGTTQSIATGQVATRADAGSLMPPGLTAGLSRTDLRDLIRFLAEQKGQ